MGNEGRLLTDREIYKSLGHEDTRYFDERFRIVAKAQDVKTADKLSDRVNIPKDMIAWLLKRLNGKDAADFMLAVSVGKPLTK